ncbi:T9SS type A sorting domain-containing protein, partial [Segatella buccae]
DGKNGPVYDLQGRRVADRLDGATRHSLPAGVYIVGGRKVVVK